MTYDDHVRPIFENKCFSCHNPDKAKGGLDLTTFNATMTGGSSGEIVAPGQPNESRLFKSLARLEEPYMPPEGDPLGKDKLDVVAAWIAGGLLENAGSKARKARTGPAIELAVPSTGRPEGPPPMPEHLPLEPVVVSARAFAPADIAPNPWAPLIAVAAPKQVLLYHSDSLRLEGVLPFPEGFPQSLAFSRNGSLLVAGGGRGGKSGRVTGWDVKSGRRVFELGNEFDSVLAADISADHGKVALGGPSRRVKVYSTRTGEELLNIKKHTDWLTALSFSPDGVLLASGDRNGGLFVWEAGTGNLFYTLKAHSAAITAVSWRADSNVLASASEDGSVRLWEMHEGKEVKNWTAHGGGVTDLAFTADGKLVSSGRDNHAKVWDGNGTQLAATKDFSDMPVAACFTHDGARFVAADWSGKVAVFSSEDGSTVGTIAANPPSIATRIQRAQALAGERSARLAEITAAEQALSADVAAADRAIAEAVARLDGAKSRLAALQKEHTDALALLQARTAERDAAKSARETAASALAQLRAQPVPPEADSAAVAAAGARLEEAAKQLASLDAALAAKQSELSVAQSTAQERKASIDAVTGEIAAADAARMAAETQRETKSKALAAQRAALTEARSAASAATAEQQFWTAAESNVARHRAAEARPELATALDERALELEKANQERARLTAAVAEAEARESSAKAEVSRLEGLLANGDQAVQAQFDTARAAHADAGSALAGLRRQLSDSEKAATAATEAHARALTALQELDRQLGRMLEAYLAALPDGS